MEGDENDLTPFWLQSSDSRRQRRLSRSSSLLFNSSAFLIVLIVTTLAFIFFIIPTILSFASQIFKPQSVKKSWDSLNLILVLFAIICGFLSRNSGENASPYEDRTVSKSSSTREVEKSNPSSPNRWYQYSDRTLSYNNGNGLTRLRNSSSYPDLRQESSWVTRDEQWQFYDDTQVSSYRPLGSDGLHQRRRPLQEPEKVEKDQNLETKNIEVDTFQKGKNRNPYSRSQPPPPPPRPPVNTSTLRVSKNKALSKPIPVTHKLPLSATTGSESPPMSSSIPPPPPPPPPFKIQDWKFVKHGDFVRIKSSGSSRSVSPDLDESEDSSIEGTSPLAASEGGQSPAPSLFCPSPDVDTKADNFIARFRAGLILEKENSFRQRDRAKSRFGPRTGLGRKNVEG
uniref:Hydroxyproline-rich glycoprotein family protein n=1 Tax=Cannabis sativa TaxID=3483 RepID=A0A803NY76_CANSA